MHPMLYYRGAPPLTDDDASSDPPSTRSSNDAPEHAAHVRSRSTAHVQSSPKRLSVFGSRSRSNTTSTTSERRSPNNSMTSSEGSSGFPPDERTASATGTRPDYQHHRTSRSFLARSSRILRRQGSKVNIVATLDEEEEMGHMHERTESHHRLHRQRRMNHHEHMKSLISDPFDFHHLTHTSPAQFPSLDQTRENDLITEFSVIRASQRAQTDLKGIHAEDIHFRNFSSDELTAYGTATTVDAVARSPPGSPEVGRTSPYRGGHTRRESRVNENFSRPVSRYPRSCPTTPPPAVALDLPPATEEVEEEEDDEAEFARRAIDEVLGLASARTYPEFIQNGEPSSYLVDDMTVRTASSNSHYDLADVPEEEETTRMWDSPESSLGYSHSRSVSHVSPPVADAHAPRIVAPKQPLSIFVAEELSRKFSQALGSPTLPENQVPSRREDVNQRRPIPRSVGQLSSEDELYDSWDADIDYCYEHAAESTSNFDWSRVSLEESQRQKVGGTEGPWLTAPSSRYLQPSPLSETTLATPDLAPASARSAPSQQAITPSSTEYEPDLMVRSAPDYFHQPVSSSILPSALGKQITHETLYEDYLAADSESDRHFPFQGIIASAEHPVSSPRSSFSPISKCNSQESLMLSRAASIVRKHRSSVSTTSVPELVHSLSNSRELMPTKRTSAGEIVVCPPSRPDSSSLHRQTKSLAEAHFLLQADSSPSVEDTDTTPPAIHDRAKSTFEVSRPSGGPPMVPAKNPNRKKTRTTSYSLFPTANAI
ncbi:hypothetical protein N7474_008828 [Penicillium riverlandense]|uniref:uncharacterized protein n=1 Tax=Penicillium riverlandense TaxID=1903569 RepID=UPI002546B09A|nr:uncharacterized protein N7474_008828 [Penicillium riverlandense]KAJ5812527.1 hypothetical protein N7474_008828 [Penicillium riverlandense]